MSPPSGRTVSPAVALLPAVSLLILSVVRPAEIHPSGRIGVALLAPLSLAVCLAALPGARRRIGRAVPLLAGLAGVLAVNTLLAVQPHAALQAAERVTVAAVALLVFRELASHQNAPGGSWRPWRATLWALTLAGGAAAVTALVQKATGFEALIGVLGESTHVYRDQALERLASGRVFGTLMLPASLAGLLGLTLPASLALALERGTGVAGRLVLVVAGLAQAVALVLTESLGGIAALALAVAVTVWVAPGPTRWKAAATTAALVAGGVFVAGGVWSRGFDWHGLSDPGHPAVLRAGNWSAGAAMLAERPLLGAGGGGYGVLYPTVRRAGMNESRHAHNTYLEMTVDYGPAAIPALIAFCAVIGAVWWRAGRAGGAVACAGAGLLAFLIHNLVDFTATQTSVLLPFAALAGALWGRVLPAAQGGRPRRSGRGLRAAMAGLLAAVVLAAGAHGLAEGAADILVQSASERSDEQGQPEAILGALERAGRLCPLNPRPPASRAAVLIFEGRFEEAIAPARRALELDPFSSSLNVALGMALRGSGATSDAYIHLVRAERLYPLGRDARPAREEIEHLIRPPGEGAAP